MKTLIIYDATGYIIQQISGSYRTPQGVPFLEVDVPDGKRVAVIDGVGVNTSAVPHTVTFEDIPPSEIEKIRYEMAQSNTELFELIMSVQLGEV